MLESLIDTTALLEVVVETADPAVGFAPAAAPPVAVIVETATELLLPLDGARLERENGLPNLEKYCDIMNVDFFTYLSSVPFV
jgi:hypothetical protein